MTHSGEAAEQDSRLSRRRIATTLLSCAAATVAVVLVWQLLLRQIVPLALPTLSPERADVVARRVGVAFSDAEQSWSDYFDETGEARPDPANLILFSHTQPSPCAGTSPATGPFYCAADNVAGFDLAFLNSLENIMSREAELGTAIVVARIIASQVQDTMTGTAGGPDQSESFRRSRILQADCLAGVWAGMAEARLGTVPPGFYARLVGAAQGVKKENIRAGLAVQRDLDPFDLTDAEAREGAFRSGNAAADPTICKDYY